MQNQNLPLLSMSRENYQVPKGEEQIVHYKAEKILFDPKDGRTRLSHPDLLKTGVKMFDEVKRNLELQGYTIEILYHPLGKYTNVRIPKDANAELAEAKAQLADKDEEIARLKAALAEKEEAKKEVAPRKEEAKAENPSENEEAKAETTPAKKGGRAKKSE